MSITLIPIEIPTRQINFTTADDTIWQVEEYHYYSSLRQTDRNGSVECFENISLEYQDLTVGARLRWTELVFDGSTFEHCTAPITAITVNHPR